ncbi:TetR/AcrR family transcriptional regulator [Nocardia camponoti]|uniref:TetR family transcriptional regulator n=1 Tax=Nocardia camponoti TaxID=1616106 RepID=A0A917QCN7_9NOCA|nr:TetR/AcrR family transcriptional regulator [Nocardia camponoti]GGK41205.1 TetR family transcriptional regulator [Nocardia camponoti]
MAATRGRPRGFDRDVALRRAMEVFWEHGYDGTSMTDLTTAMGINSPSLYAAFGDKEALFRAAVDLYGQSEGSITAQALRNEPTAYAAVSKMLRDNVVCYTALGKQRGCLVVLAGRPAITRTEGVGEFLATARLSVTDALRARLDAGVAAGEFRPETDTAALATFYSTVLNGLSIQARDGVSRDDLLASADQALTVLAAARQ